MFSGIHFGIVKNIHLIMTDQFSIYRKCAQYPEQSIYRQYSLEIKITLIPSIVPLVIKNCNDRKGVKLLVAICNHHHHHVVPLARIFLILSRHFSLSFIASGRSSGLHPVSSQSCCMYVRAGRPAFAWPSAGVHRSTSLMSSSLLLQQCPACLVHLTWIVFMVGGRWPYSWCLEGCYHQDLFNIALNDSCMEETAFHFIGQV